MIKLSSVIVFGTIVGCCILAGQSLDLEAVKEGSCQGFAFKPQANINLTWLENAELRYISAGSKYHLYRIVANHYDVTIPEYKFYYESCLENYQEDGFAIAEGFRGNLKGQYELNNTGPGELDFTPIDPATNQTTPDTSKHVLTLTDNKSFVFWANCWQQADQRGWDVMTVSNIMEPETKRMIEEHAVSLGFEKDNFVFLNYDACPLTVTPRSRSNSSTTVLDGVFLPDE